MFDVMNLKLSTIIRNYQIVSEDTIDMEKYNKILHSYIYPFGIFPINALDLNPRLVTLSEEEMLEYLSTLLHSMFSNLYSEEEYSIIIYYLFLRFEGRMTYDSTKVAKIEELIKIAQNKPEIIYLQEELKFNLASHYSLTMTNNERLIQLLNELETIEKAHNAFNMYLRIQT